MTKEAIRHLTYSFLSMEMGVGFLSEGFAGKGGEWKVEGKPCRELLRK
ncbi:MAG: hypothetical protein AAFY41_18970 [Bacteroidota bacterium]